jgi:hypothetical protein
MDQKEQPIKDLDRLKALVVRITEALGVDVDNGPVADGEISAALAIVMARLALRNYGVPDTPALVSDMTVASMDAMTRVALAAEGATA